MEENTQLPKEVVEEINEQADKYGFVVPYNGSNKFYNDDKLEGYKAGATTYATKLHQANESIKVLTYDNNRLKGEVEGLTSAVEELKRWKEEAKAVINPIWEYADALKVPLGESKTEAVIKHAKELEHQNEKLKATATGWRPLLEKVLVMNEMWGDLPGEFINEVKSFLYGE